MRTRNPRLWSKIFFSLIVAVAIAIAIGIVRNIGPDQIPYDPSAKTSSQTADEVLISSIVGYLANPRFSSNNLLEQISGTKARLEKHIEDEDEAHGGTLYFSLPMTIDLNATIARLSKHPEKVQLGKVTSKGLEVGSLVISKRNVQVFCFAAYDLKVNPRTLITVEFPAVTYGLTVSELADFMEDKPLINGEEIIEFPADKTVVSNFGSRVAKAGEPSLSRLAVSIVGTETDPGRKAQALLDFVTTNIVYDETEKDWNDQIQVVKRPNEVLMTKTATCGSLVTLYASLLEQVGVDYWLLYYDHHIAVAVEGKFAKTNDNRFTINGKTYSLAETTNTRFVIGRTRLDSDFINSPAMYQQPTRSLLIHATGK